MKTLTKRNSAYVEKLANTEQTRLNPVSKHQVTGSGDLEGGPDSDNVNQEQVVLAEDVGVVPRFEEVLIFADPHDWETDNET